MMSPELSYALIQNRGLWWREPGLFKIRRFTVTKASNSDPS